MQKTLNQPAGNGIDIAETPLNSQQETTVLNALNEGVFVALECAGSFKLTFANKAMRLLLNNPENDVIGDTVSDLFSRDQAEVIVQSLAAVLSELEQKQIGLTIGADGSDPDGTKHLRITMVPDVSHAGSTPIICLVHDVTTLSNRAMYLEDRAVKLIENTNVLESSRRDLEKEILRLRTHVKKLKRSARFDSESGLPNRSHFLERATAEFQRSRRYDHNLSLVIAQVVGYQETIATQSEDAGKRLIIGLAQLCETASRHGIDITGRVSQNEIAVLLPETDLTGSLLFVDRLTTLVGETPIQIKDGHVRLGIRTSTDSIQSDDHTLMQAFSRAQSNL